jgi:hypothetical protein
MTTFASATWRTWESKKVDPLFMMAQCIFLFFSVYGVTNCMDAAMLSSLLTFSSSSFA